MRIVEVPAALPGCCFICNSTNRASYIDTEMSIDIDSPPFPGPMGAVYICNMCINEFATMYSYLSPDDHKDIRKQKDELESLNYELIKRVGALEESLDALARAGYRRIDDDSVARIGGAFLETMESDADFPSFGTESVGAGEGETSQPFNDEGMGELSSDDTDDSKFTLDI